jgi:hypothetical protein
LLSLLLLLYMLLLLQQLLLLLLQQLLLLSMLKLPGLHVLLWLLPPERQRPLVRLVCSTHWPSSTKCLSNAGDTMVFLERKAIWCRGCRPPAPIGMAVPIWIVSISPGMGKVASIIAAAATRIRLLPVSPASWCTFQACSCVWPLGLLPSINIILGRAIRWP